MSAKLTKLDEYLPNVVAFGSPLEPGARLGGRDLLVLEVLALAATLHGRRVFVALHEKDSSGRMLTMFVCDGVQRPWVGAR